MVEETERLNPSQVISATKKPGDPRSNDEIAAQIVHNDPIELEPRDRTLDSPVIIEVACPGWQLREWPKEEYYASTPPNYEQGETRYPAVPCSIDDQAREIITAADEGCAASHIHPRDPEDCFAVSDPELLTEVYDRIFEETDVVPIQHSWEYTDDGEIDYVEPAKEVLKLANGSNRYLEGAVVLWPPNHRYTSGYRQAVQEGVKFYNEHDIKPIHKLRSNFSVRRLHRYLVETGIETEGPHVLIHDMGHPTGWPMDQNPWSPVEMIASLEQTKHRFSDDTVIGVYSGNRNWMPVTMMAILLGVDVVRVGIEDVYWMYPHKDDIARRNIDIVRKITGFCERIGREIASPEQAREILGINQT